MGSSSTNQYQHQTEFQLRDLVSGWSLTFRRAAWFVMGALVFAGATQRPAHSITINMEYTDEGDDPPHDENPSWDPSGLILKAHFQAAKQIWERLLPGNEEYTFDFHWDNDIDGLGLATEGIDTYIEINPDYNYFADPTPNSDEEFALTGTQKLFGELTGAEQTTFFPGTAPPDALETGYWRDGLATGVGAGGFDANDGYDLLTVVLHEIGHILGISGVEPGEYNIYPHHVGGLVDVLVLEDNDSGHLAGDDMVPGFLICNACATRGGRYYPTATDVLVIAEDQGLTSVHLERVGSISAGIWGDQSKWIGANVPDITQDAYIRHGGTVTLNADQQARSLLVAAGSSVQVQNHQLTVDGALTFNSATLSVGAGGTIAAHNITGDPSGLTTTAGSLVRFNSFSRGASGATSASFSGSVAIGYDTSAPGQDTATFDPDTITLWNVAEQLAIGDHDTTSTLAINGGVDFFSTTGRIGTSFGGGAGHVNIHQAGSTWTIGGMTGALDARHGTLNVFDLGYLQTGSTTLGADLGQMHATVNGGSWLVSGSVDVGPPSATGNGRGRLTVQNGGSAIVLGNVAVHGTGSLPSEITVESSGRLQVDGQIIVRQAGKVIYRDGTMAGDTTFENQGATVANGTGGVTQFYDEATASSATFTNLGGTAGGAGAGQTTFADDSNAGTATFNNENADTSFATGGFTAFFGSSDAGSATFHNSGALVGGRGYTRFYDNASAGDATFSNKPSPLSGGATEFWGFSTADHATITNETQTPGASRGGEILFRDNATAGNATLICKDGQSTIEFRGNSTAANSKIILEDVQLGSFLRFWDDATAGSAEITVGKAGYAQFYERSDAGNAMIRVHAGTSSGQGNGILSVSGSSSPLAVPQATLADSTITADGGTVGGAPGGAVAVVGFGSTAGNAMITANGGTVTGASGGTIAFSSGGHAGRATLIANGGSGGGGGGRIVFGFDGLGDFARVILNGGILDLNNNATTAVGSIEGVGTANLASRLLMVGTLDSSTTFSGNMIGAGGRFTKVGTGKLTLGGTNTFTGLTTVDEGRLVVNGSIAGGVVVKDGGVLGGIGSMGNVVVEQGGIFAPGESPGTITVGGLNLMAGSTLEYELGAIRDRIVVTNNGNVTLDGLLDLSILNGFDPAPGQTFELFEGAIGSITGAFSAVNAPLFNGHTLDLVYGVNQVTLQVIDAIFPPGDYNQNGIVDAADYTVWRDTGGTPTGYDVWQANFGATLGSGANEAAVPEPATSALLLIAGAIAFFIPAYRRPYFKRKDGPR